MKAITVTLFCRLVAVVTGAVILATACSKDDNIITINPDDDDNTKVETVLAAICTEWGCPKERVAEVMHGYTLLESTPETVSYTTPDNSYDIIYEFHDSGLRSALIMIADATSEENYDAFSLKDFQYFGKVDGASIYIRESTSDMAAIMKRTVDGHQYLGVGFCPYCDGMFERIDPITVEILPATDITTKTCTIYGRVSGATDIDNFYFSLTKEGSDDAPRKLQGIDRGDGNYSYHVTNLELNSTYIYTGYAVIDGVSYHAEGSSQRVTLESVKVYEVGDLWPDNNNPEGVVWSVQNSGDHGTIISLDQDFIKWDTTSLFCTDYNAYDQYDGSNNNLGTRTPYAVWINSHGSGWYGPAKAQLQKSTSTIEAVNTTLRRLGKREMDGFYWTSTQKNSNNAWVVTVTPSSYAGYANGYTFFNGKDQLRSVRAMKNF